MWNEQKRGVLEALMPMCPFVVLSTEHEGVELPERVYDRSVLIARIGRDPDVAWTEGLILGPEGIFGQLTGDGDESCFAPWSSISGYWIAAPFVGPTVQWPEPKIRLRAEAVSAVITRVSHLRAIK